MSSQYRGPSPERPDPHSGANPNPGANPGSNANPNANAPGNAYNNASTSEQWGPWQIAHEETQPYPAVSKPSSVAAGPAQGNASGGNVGSDAQNESNNYAQFTHREHVTAPLPAFPPVAPLYPPAPGGPRSPYLSHNSHNSHNRSRHSRSRLPRGGRSPILLIRPTLAITAMQALRRSHSTLPIHPIQRRPIRVMDSTRLIPATAGGSIRIPTGSRASSMGHRPIRSHSATATSSLCRLWP